MGLYVVLKIAKVEPGTQIDVAGLNAALMNGSGLDELYEAFSGGQEPGFNGPFQITDDGRLQIAQRWDSEFSGYGDSTQVWSCFGLNEARTIGKFITEGKVVFHEEIEGNDDQFYICTPGKAEQKNARQLAF